MTTANPTSVHSTPGPRLPQVFGLANGGTHIMVTDRGASWLSCELDMGPDSRREILLGHQEPFMYGSQPGYLGAIVGRYANRIAGSRFVDATGQTHVLTPNEGEVQLHGGLDGFDKRDWQVLSRGPSRLVLGLESPAGDQGFPGNLQAQVTYEVALDGAVTIRFDTRVDAVCPVNLSSHGYFNLDGADAQSDFGDVLDHTLWIAAKRYLPIDARLIPTGELAAVEATPFDFSTAQRLRGALAQNQDAAADGRAAHRGGRRRPGLRALRHHSRPGGRPARGKTVRWGRQSDHDVNHQLPGPAVLQRQLSHRPARTQWSPLDAPCRAGPGA